MPQKHQDRKLKDMSPSEIRIALLRQGKWMQAAIARDLSVSKAAVYRTIEGKLVSHRIRTAIADRTRIDLVRIWPSTYLYGPGPRKSGRPQKDRRRN